MVRKPETALREQIQKTIRKLPADIDAVVAADVALEILIDSAWLFVRKCKTLPPSVIRELLGRKPTDASHIYLTDQPARYKARSDRALVGAKPRRADQIG